MATRDIKTRFKLEGEQEFKRAMSDAANAVKVLNSEEKLAKAQFESTGDAQQYAADQARILKEQIEEQKKAVAAAEKAVKELTDNGVDKNAKHMLQWRDKLNKAKTALLNMQTRLDKVGTELGEEQTKFGDAQAAGVEFQKGMEEVAKGIDLQNAITAIDSVTGHIEAIVKTAAKAAKAVWEMGVEGSVWADNLATAANEVGLDVETYQSWDYASKFIDTSVRDIVQNWKDIDSKMIAEGDALRDYLELLNSVGIASADQSGLRAGKDIFWEMIDYLHNIGDEGERTRQALKLFGSDWRKLNPLITAGSKAYMDMAEEGRRVAVVSSDQVAQLGQMNDEYEDLQSRLQKLKMGTLAKLAPTFNEVAKALSTAVTAMNEFVESEEGQEAIAGLNEALSGVIKSFLGEDNGKGTFEAIVNGATGAVTGLTEAMDWISKNGGTVEGIILGLGSAWAGLTVTKEVLTFVMLLRALPLDKLGALFSGGKSLTQASGGGSLSGGAGAGTGTATGGGTGTKKVMNAAKRLNLAGAKDLLLGLGVEGAVLTAGILPAVLADEWDRNNITEQMQNFRDAAVEAAQGMGEEGQKAVEIIMAATDALGVSETKTDALGRRMMTDLVAVEDDLKRVNQLAEETEAPVLSGKTKLLLKRQGMTGGLSIQAENDLLQRVIQDTMNYLDNPSTVGASGDLAGNISDAMDKILEVQEAIDESPGDNIENLYGLIDELVENKDVFDSLSTATQDLLGAYFDTESGFGAGSTSQFADAQAVLEAMFADLDAAWEEAYKSASDGGKQVDVGLANGIYESADVAIKAANWLARSVANQCSQVLMIRSPSRVFEQFGEYVGEGFANGINESVAAVDHAMGRMISVTTRRPARYRSGSAESTGLDAAPGVAHVTLMVDEDVLGDVVTPLVNDRIGAKINATRR